MMCCGKRKQQRTLEELPRWFNGHDSMLPVQGGGGPDCFLGQGARYHMPQLRAGMPQLKIPRVALGPSIVKINIKKKKKDFGGGNKTGLKALSLIDTLFSSFSVDKHERHTLPSLKLMIIKTAQLKKMYQSHTTLRPGGNRSRQVLCTSPPRLCRWFPE